MENVLRTDRQANGRIIQRILGKSGLGHFFEANWTRHIGSWQIGPRKIGPETRYGLALGGQEAASGDDGFLEEDQGDELLQRITHGS